MNGELKIRVLSRSGEPLPATQAPTVSAPTVSVSPSAPTTAGPDLEAGLGARVRQALCCPYCRESLSPEELRGDAHAHPEHKAAYTTPRELGGLLAVSGAGLLTYLLQQPLTSPMGAALGLSVCLGPLVFLVLRNAGAAIWARYGIGGLVREARELWRQGETSVSDEHAVLGCARPGCGAVYHAECWEECKASYGACAVFACGSREAKGVSETQLRLRGLRLLLAAFLFPQRLVDAVRKVDDGDEQGDLARLRAAIRERAKATHQNLWTEAATQRKSGWTRLFSLLQLGTVVAGSVAGLAIGRSLSGAVDTDDAIVPMLVGCVAVPTALALMLYGSSWFVALALYAAKSLLSSEFSALARLGQRGAFLGRSSSQKKG